VGRIDAPDLDHYSGIRNRHRRFDGRRSDHTSIPAWTHVFRLYFLTAVDRSGNESEPVVNAPTASDTRELHAFGFAYRTVQPVDDNTLRCRLGEVTISTTRERDRDLADQCTKRASMRNAGADGRGRWRRAYRANRARAVRNGR
jgi:hypothetical protein